MNHDRDPKHAPDEPTADKLPVEPEMDKGPRGQDPRQSGRTPHTEPAKEKEWTTSDEFGLRPRIPNYASSSL